MKRIFTTVIGLVCTLLSFCQWNNDVAINTEAAKINSADIVTASASDGKTWIAFYSQNGSNYDMRAQLLDASGNRLLGDSGILVSNRKSGSATYVFNTCVDKDNNLVIAFQYQKTLSTMVCIAYKINQAGQQLWGNGVEVGIGLSPNPAALSNGDIAVAWNNDAKINYLVINSDGSITWAAAKEISGGTKSVTRPQLVAFTGNNFGIVYQYVDAGFFGSHLFEQKYDIDGNPLWPAAVKLTDYITSTFAYSVVMSDEDTTYISYYANPSGQNRFDAFVQRVNHDGVLPWGLRGSDFSDDNTNNNELSCNISHLHGSPYIWATSNISDLDQIKYGISLQKFNIATGEVLLGNKGKQLLPVSSETYHDLGIALCDDKPLIVYTDVASKIYAAGLDGNGNPLWSGNSIDIASSFNFKYRYGFTQVINGQAVMVWQENKGAGDRPYAQNINCDGFTGVLPVSITNFNAKKEGNYVKLYWQTQSENNNKGFYAEKSADGKTFSPIGFISSGSKDGNSNITIDYSFSDQNPFAGNNFYRLKQVDKDGHFAYSNINSISFLNQFIIKMYPNPVKNILNITSDNIFKGDITVTIRSADGKMADKTILQNINSNTININTGKLKQGLYYINIGVPGSAGIIQKFIKE